MLGSGWLPKKNTTEFGRRLLQGTLEILILKTLVQGRFVSWAMAGASGRFHPATLGGGKENRGGLFRRVTAHFNLRCKTALDANKHKCD